jgi:tRNA A37 threonylcarbamoyladenosine synthetase subunit TsaC/SUA5/YrdC
MMNFGNNVTRDQLKLVYDQFADEFGGAQATAALQRATGARTLAQVPDNKIIKAVVELMGRPMTICKANITPEQKLAQLHATLNEMSKQRFARLRGEKA